MNQHDRSDSIITLNNVGHTKQKVNISRLVDLTGRIESKYYIMAKSEKSQVRSLRMQQLGCRNRTIDQVNGRSNVKVETYYNDEQACVCVSHFSETFICIFTNSYTTIMFIVAVCVLLRFVQSNATFLCQLNNWRDDQCSGKQEGSGPVK